MSGAASLAAAKRRRGGTQTNNQRANTVTSGNNKLEQSEQPEQPIFTPMSILTQHHIRLQVLETAQNAVEVAMGGTDELNDFDERLVSLEKHSVEKSIIEDKMQKMQKQVSQIDKQIKDMNRLLLQVQTSAVEANNNAIKSQDNKVDEVSEQAIAE
jgi:hypothetical protein